MGNLIGLILILMSVLLGAVGQILMKAGMSKIGLLKDTPGILNAVLYFLKAIFSPLVFTGLFSYFVSMIIWLWVLAKYELTYARPFVSLGYVIIILYSFFILNEHINITRWIGLLLTIAGVYLVAKS